MNYHIWKLDWTAGKISLKVDLEDKKERNRGGNEEVEYNRTIKESWSLSICKGKMNS